MVFESGATAYIIESNRIIREVNVVKRSGEFYIVKFLNGSGGIRIRASRLFASKDAAEDSIPRPETTPKNRYHSPYDYWH